MNTNEVSNDYGSTKGQLLPDCDHEHAMSLASQCDLSRPENMDELLSVWIVESDDQAEGANTPDTQAIDSGAGRQRINNVRQNVMLARMIADLNGPFATRERALSSIVEMGPQVVHLLRERLSNDTELSEEQRQRMELAIAMIVNRAGGFEYDAHGRICAIYAPSERPDQPLADRLQRQISYIGTSNEIASLVVHGLIDGQGNHLPPSRFERMVNPAGESIYIEMIENIAGQLHPNGSMYTAISLAGNGDITFHMSGRARAFVLTRTGSLEHPSQNQNRL